MLYNVRPVHYISSGPSHSHPSTHGIVNGINSYLFIIRYAAVAPEISDSEVRIVF